ncbi:hypothetical protein GCM10010449_18170 [Streptomyces rectiviolaceus]|uniref:Uncharacterized protein n=1 Tax=Streptomyces rectiviolaceus TaxID=332591 RepID=A0ABP6MDR9_9ACTN
MGSRFLTRRDGHEWLENIGKLNGESPAIPDFLLDGVETLRECGGRRDRAQPVRVVRIRVQQGGFQ